MKTEKDIGRAPAVVMAYAMIEGLIGIALLVGGGRLITLGGSMFYAAYGLLLVLSASFLFRRHNYGVIIGAVAFVLAVAWSFVEAGFDFWQWVPRIGIPLVLAIGLALVTPRIRPSNAPAKVPARWVAGLLAVGLVGGICLAFVPLPLVAPSTSGSPLRSAQQDDKDWAAYGRTPDGTRYAPANQITPANVGKLQVAWTFHTGEVAKDGAEDQNTPLQIGDKLYVCTPRNQVIALDADQGTETWRFNPHSESPVWQRCRGLAYHAASVSSGQMCSKRIYMATNDARLFAIDAETGKLCNDFGASGTVDLKRGMGTAEPGVYSQTSAPTIAGDLIVVGGRVYDNISVGEPSGVVRAFDARTGKLAWAYDIGNSSLTGEPAEGQTYTRGTPNVWAAPAVDEKLGLIYLPTGNSTPDFWGAERTPAEDSHSSSVVALDYRTGRERWVFQTTHHDLWDYDVPAQPTLYDVPDGKGGTLPALIQVTKRGQIFMLDRRSGKPIARVEERKVPKGDVPGERYSATQPFSVGMPAIGADPLSERRMWGMSMFDQLWCRVAFRKLRYDGDMTPPSIQGTLEWPGFYGGMNWGSASVNRTNDYLIVNDIRLAQVLRLVPRGETDRIIASAKGSGGAGHDGINPQGGTPYGALLSGFMSPLGVPCQNPPFGTMTAIDLKTRQIVWQRPLGTTQDTGPLGFKTHLRVPIGTPTLSGALTTRSGLIFYTGTTDYYLRAMDVRTGKELLAKRMPVGGQATPMTFVSPRTKRQYVVVTAGGARQSPDRGDLIIAFALPKAGARR
ncbi:membrane-bound PQQ-dependent dehydrogenase, glucose/quinate/shikimate family [Sphingomonas sp. Leaf25]|uniref:membrane-bound PQQ-dependent dehydrogenase, glucose/quinate/shikimate family n=1 Tax=Sphingomonas sp. Leaf25 TaxID=1735692 RepID=UPI0006F93FCE|nr:membrane-bound PQQ-dependent dehydrogenase, glucose/quinate/shikimate family [Sphingomonas sp. Leaf25]KQM99381.1 glucose dehydrogenase [Sphingomonas sp. Leaf25]